MRNLKSICLWAIAMCFATMSKAQCDQSAFRFNFFVAAPFKAGASVTWFPVDEHWGVEGGVYMYQYQKRAGKYLIEQPAVLPVGRAVYRVNQYGMFKHEITMLVTPREVGLTYRFKYDMGDINVGIEPAATTRGPACFAFLNFDL